jgi:hypothetical protein
LEGQRRLVEAEVGKLRMVYGMAVDVVDDVVGDVGGGVVVVDLKVVVVVDLKVEY